MPVPGDIVCEVRTHRGSPTLFIDGQPHTGLTFFFGRAADSAEDIARFAEAGIHMYSGCIGLSATQGSDGSFDFGTTDGIYERIIRADPEVLILPRVDLRWWDPPRLGTAEQSGQVQVDITEVAGKRRTSGWSFTSPVWRRLAGEELRAYIRHCEQRFGRHIVGYHLGAGAAGEWSYAWSAVLSDYSEAQQMAFRQWLRDQYGNDTAALRNAWGDPKAALEAAAIPPPERRLRRQGADCLLDPVRDRDVIDYLRFHSEAVARALVHFCGVAKTALRELGRRKLVGGFYGYHFKNLNKPANFHNAGHFAQQIVLDSPDVDFLCAPYCYQGREHGNAYLAQLVAGSVRLRGKLYWCEDDTFTFRSRRESGRSRCPDRGTTIGVLRRNLAGVLRDGGTLWWMDCGGNGPLRPGGQVDGWYRDGGLMENFARMQGLAAARLARGDYTPSAQVAVFVSDASAVYHSEDAALMDALIMRQMFEIGHLGAPFDTYRVADLALLFERPWSRNYRLLVFPDALYLSPDERDVLCRKVRTRGRTILWTYGAGIITDKGLSPEAMAETTGISVKLRRRNEPLIVSTFELGSRLLYGTERPIGPVIYGADDKAEVKGWLITESDPGLLARRFDDWRSVWSAAPAVPAALLRRVARAAGVHLYVETGESVMRDGDLLTLHAGMDGERTILLPARCDVMDAYTDEAVAPNTDRFAVTMERGSTATWWVRRLAAGT